jgi:hypothetical protein
MATAGQVIRTAQSVYLNDFNNKTWSQAQLMEYLKEAHRQMQVELQLNGIPVLKQQTAQVTVPQIPDMNTWPGYVLMPSQPDNLVQPIACWERPISDDFNSDWDEMVFKSFPPKVDPVNDLVYWTWMGEKIVFVGATQDNEVQLQYNGGIPIPQATTDPIGFINGETYLAPKLSALANASIGGEKQAAKNEKIAEIMLDKILCSNVMGEQGTVSRRKPYRHGSVPFVIR